MQKEKNNWKPVKTLAVIFMAGLLLVLLPKFGTEAKAATEITSTTTSWSGEMQVTSGDMTINNWIRLDNNVTLSVSEGKKLTVNCGIRGSKTITFTGPGTLEINDSNSTGYAVFANIILNGGTIIVNGKNADSMGTIGVHGSVTINNGTMRVHGGNALVEGMGGIGVQGSVTLNGGSLTVTGGNSAGMNQIGSEGVSGSVTLNNGTMTVYGGEGNNGGDAIWGTNEDITTLNGGMLTAIGGNGNGGDGSGIGGGPLFLNGGKLLAKPGTGNPEMTWRGIGSTASIGSNLHYSIDGQGDYTGTLNDEAIISANGKLLAPIYAVNITAGTAMTKTANSGSASQNRVIGEMTDVIYTADEGYYFPTNYSVASANGVSVTRNSFTQITVSGTPTADTTITLPAASAQTKQDTPNARFSATGTDKGTLYDLINGAEYVLSGAVSTSFTASGTSKEIESVTAGAISIIRKGNGEDKKSSDAQSITVAKATTPDSVTATDCSTASNNNGILSGITTAMEYRKSDCADWTAGSGNDITGLANGTYYVRVKASGVTLASENQILTIKAYSAPVDQNPTQGNTDPTPVNPDPVPVPSVVTPVYYPEPIAEKSEEAPKSSTTKKNKDGSIETDQTIKNEDGTVTNVNDKTFPDGTTEIKEEIRDAKGNGTLSAEKKDADGNLLSKTEGTIKVSKKGTETIKSTTENSDGSTEEKTQKTYKRDDDGNKKVTTSAKKTDSEGNTEEIKKTELVNLLGEATVTEKRTVTTAGTTVKEEKQYSVSVNGRVKLTSLASDGEKVTVPETLEVDGKTRDIKAIGKNAMKGNKTVKEVVLGENITTICTGAFKNCKNLELIELTGSVKKIYKNAFKGIAENAKFVIKASQEDFERIVELLKESGVSDTVTFERVEA